MENLNIYQDIKSRTQGDIYIGVVGPVRTGKSTFIKRFMELLILPFSVMRYASEKYCFTLLSIKNFLNAFIGNLFLYNCCRKEDPFQRTRLSSYLTLRNEL